MGYVKIIPEMINNNTPSPFVASASSQLATYVPSYAFQSGTSAWITDVANSYLQIDLGKPHRVEKVYFDSTTDWTYARVLTFQLLASNDATAWITLEDTHTTANYDFTGIKKYGEYRYWRLVCKSMTGRGGVVRQFQLYKTDFEGEYNISEPDTFIVEGATSALKASVKPDTSASITIKVNDKIVYENKDFTEALKVEVPYSAEDFNIGANLLSTILVDAKGNSVELEHVIFKLTKTAAVPKLTSYQFAIKNSPTYPRTDGWIGQVYNFEYLNSETGLSYMFRYKPYARLDARLEDESHYADKVVRGNVTGGFSNIFGERAVDGSSGIILDLKKSSVSTIRRAVQSDGYSSGFKEAGVVQQIFKAWAIIDKEDIGIVSNATLAMKRDKVVHNSLSSIRNKGYRNRELTNTLNIMNAQLTSQRRTGNAVIDYYELFNRIHQRKDTIVALGYLNSIPFEKIVHYNNLDKIADKALLNTQMLESEVLGDKEELIGIKDEYTKAQILMPYRESTSIYQTVAYKIDRYGHKYPHVTLTTQEEGIGVKQEYLNATRLDRQGFINEILSVDKHLENRVVYLESFFLIDKHVKTKEGFMSNMILIDDTVDIDAYITHSSTNVNLMPNEAKIDEILNNVLLMETEVRVSNEDIKMLHKMPISAHDIQDNIHYLNLTPIDANDLGVDFKFVNKQSKDALLQEVDNQKIEVMPIESWIIVDQYFLNKLPKDSNDIKESQQFFNNAGKDVWILTDVTFIEKDGRSKEGFEVKNYDFVDNVGKEVSVITYDSYTDPLEGEAFDLSTTIDYVDKNSKGVLLDELNIVVDKLKAEVFKMEVLQLFNALEKVNMVLESWDFFTRMTQEGKSLEDASIRFIKEERDVINFEDKVAVRKLKDTFLMEQLAIDHENLDAYITQLAGNFERVDEHDADELITILADKNIATGFIQESINAYRENVEKEAIVEDNVLLVDDESEWQDIWNRYSPGVDVLDPPDDDYDYSKLVPMVYDEVTGKPMHPIGATNKPNVVVGVPLKHPIPDNNEVGIDETKRIAVDNYIFIDTVLALESIKGRNKLRYAGMPAGKAIREVFSQLYTWIQQAAPGHEEYERMFRFARWYAESITIKQSKFILERVYNPWISSLHRGGGLGTPHMKAGWIYNTVTNTYDTTSAAAHLEFTKELMIDGQFILRGYFDNPSSHGTIRISVDGVIVETFASNGVFSIPVDVPQGHHTFRIDFLGIGSSVSISTIEITGVQFVSAITVTDDSDTNGLKALNELMSQLLGYFELHHGGNKVKGTMEIRQRAVWNTHT